MEVHNELGHGFSEIVYKDALQYEFEDGLIPYEREKEYPVYLIHKANHLWFVISLRLTFLQLKDVGLPQNNIPLALFLFNAGVETGQLAFVLVMLLLMAAINKIAILVNSAWLVNVASHAPKT